VAGDLRGFATAAILTAALATTPASAEKHRDAEGLHRLIVSKIFAALRQDPETAELRARRRFGHGSMDGQYKTDLFRRIQILSRGDAG
jgi:hypothetical protein